MQKVDDYICVVEDDLFWFIDKVNDYLRKGYVFINTMQLIELKNNKFKYIRELVKYKEEA